MNVEEMEAETPPTLLDAPPTPWEEDNPFPDTIEEPTPSVQMITANMIKEEQERFAGMNLSEKDERLKKEWKAEANAGIFAVVAMRPTSYVSKKPPHKKVFLEWCPRPDVNSLQFITGKKEALQNAITKAQLVLDMPPAMRAEFLCYNVMGPFQLGNELARQTATADREGLRRTVFRVSTRIFKKGTKQMHVTQVLSRGSKSSSGQYENFAERFPGGIVPWKAIMEAAETAGVKNQMTTVLHSYAEDAAGDAEMNTVD